MKDLYPELSQRIMSYDPSELLISAVTVFELEYGAAKSNWGERTRQKLYTFLAPFSILPFSTEDAIAAGNIRYQLTKQGNTIGPYDIQIAAQGVARGLTVVTHNTGEFSRIPNLRIEDWAV